MAREINPALHACDAGHGRPVVAFAARADVTASLGPWYACCEDLCLPALAADFVYVRIGADRDRSDTPAPLKQQPPAADAT